MKKVAFYCQHLLGIGHLTRSLAISEELVKHFDVTFIQGGPDIGKTITSPYFKHILIDPFLMNEADNVLYDPKNEKSVDEIWQSRNNKLQAVFNEKFDHLIVELYPFGRNKFNAEVINLMEKLKESNPAIKIHCSLRDILVEKKDAEKRNQKILKIIDKYFDTVLVHSDPEFIKLDDTFSNAKELSDKIVYTGYITEDKKEAPTKRPSSLNKILFSMGGGIVGEELYRASFPLIEQFPENIFHYVIGPYTSIDLKNELEELKFKHPNILVTPLLKNFEAELLNSALSISMAGYNTVMNLLNTKTKAIVYPYKANIEQEMRSRKLMNKKLVYVLEDEDINPVKLKGIIQNILISEYSLEVINLDGTTNTTKYLLSINP